MALIVYLTHFCYAWTYYTLLTELPTYLNDELDYDLSSSGIISVIPYLAQFFVTVFGGFFIDAVIERGILTVWNGRRFAQIIGTIVPGVLLCICAYLNDTEVIVILLSIATALMGFCIPGVVANYSDISPTLSSVMFGVGNTFCTLSGVISPILTGWILKAEKDNKAFAWKLVFYIAFGLVVIGTGLFCIFGQGHQVDALNIDQNKNLNDDGVDEYDKDIYGSLAWDTEYSKSVSQSKPKFNVNTSMQSMNHANKMTQALEQEQK